MDLKRPYKKMGYSSDFHFERHCNLSVLYKRPEVIEDAPFDFVVLPGDIVNSARVAECLAIMQEKMGCHLYYTPGNHEFWGGVRLKKDLDEQVAQMRSDCEVLENVTFLYNEGVDIPDTNSSLFMSPWFTDMGAYKGDKPVSDIQGMIGDYYRTTVKGELITAADHLRLNLEAQEALEAWLKDVVARGREAIIATHFGPSRRSAHSDFPDDDLVSAYFNTDYLDRNHGIFPPRTIWIHGHTHWNVDYFVGDVYVTSNQYGYQREFSCNDTYNPLKYIEVQ